MVEFRHDNSWSYTMNMTESIYNFQLDIYETNTRYFLKLYSTYKIGYNYTDMTSNCFILLHENNVYKSKYKTRIESIKLLFSDAFKSKWMQCINNNEYIYEKIINTFVNYIEDNQFVNYAKNDNDD